VQDANIVNIIQNGSPSVCSVIDYYYISMLQIQVKCLAQAGDNDKIIVIQSREHGTALHFNGLQNEQIDNQSQNDGNNNHFYPLQRRLHKLFHTGHSLHLNS
jgi:hypothetical protein